MVVLRAVAPEDEPGLLVLNNAHATELSLLTAARFSALLANAFIALTTGQGTALLLAFEETAAYDSPNFRWFRNRYDRFIYVDRIVVSPAAQGRGVARRLYAELLTRAQRAGHKQVACEVNIRPPNPQSDALHAALGFTPVGEASIYEGSKTVRYLLRPL